MDTEEFLRRQRATKRETGESLPAAVYDEVYLLHRGLDRMERRLDGLRSGIVMALALVALTALCVVVLSVR